MVAEILPKASLEERFISKLITGGAIVGAITTLLALGSAGFEVANGSAWDSKEVFARVGFGILGTVIVWLAYRKDRSFSEEVKERLWSQLPIGR